MSAKQTQQHDGPSVREYVAIAWRRRLVIVIVLVAVPLIALSRSMLQDAEFQAAASVLLAQNDRAGELLGIDGANIREDPERFATTQARLARVKPIAGATLNASHVDLTPDELLAASSVVAAPDSDFLRFTVTDAQPERAALLATEYARQFVAYRKRLDSAALAQGVSHVGNQLKALRQSGQAGTGLYTRLLDVEQQLVTMQVLQSPRAILADQPSAAEQVRPRPIRDVVIAVGLAALLALALAFLLEALDTRLRSEDELTARIGLPLLGRTAADTRRNGSESELPTVYDPSGFQAEAYRMLRLNVEFANLGPRARLVLVASALPEEGKTVTAANLAVSFARAGRNVLLIDLDLRKPRLHELFKVSHAPGVTEVALGVVELDDAILHGVLGSGDELKPIRVSREAGPTGDLAFLPAGSLPPDPARFVDTSALAQLLLDVRPNYDIVLIDTPPLLRVGDGLALGSLVEAVLVVSRSGVLRKSEIREFRDTLDAMQALKLGLVLTGVETRPAYAQPYSAPRPTSRLSAERTPLEGTRQA